MLKRNLLLGLMVFMVGVLITACGDKNNTTNNTTTEKKAFENTCDDCTRTYDGRFRILDEELYMNAFGHSTGFNFNTGFDLFPGDDFFSQTIGQGINAGVNTGVQIGTGIVACEISSGITRFFANLGNYDIEEEECDVASGDFLNNFNGSDELDTVYDATLRIKYRRGRIDSVDLVIEDVLNGNDSETFYFEEDNIFVNDDGDLFIQNASGRVRLGTVNGSRVIGEFSN